MAVANPPKHMWIPPPPLPEFYLPKDKVKKKLPSSSSSGTDTENTIVVEKPKDAVKVTFESREDRSSKDATRGAILSWDGAYDGLPPLGRYVTAPVPPQAPHNSNWNQVSPLAVYHICRICVRPRSARYHREHPIPIDGVPPPPGICRRCRVTSVQETSEITISDVDEVVKTGESAEIKLGLAAFLPEEAFISNGEAKKMQAERHLRGRSKDPHITIFREASSESRHRPRRSKSRRPDIVYRHVKVIEETESGIKVADVRPAPRHTVKSTEVTRTDGSTVPQESKPASKTTNRVAPSMTTETVVITRPERTDSEIRHIAGEEARRYANDLRQQERPDSEIRRIAHEEVARYRDAERKLGARPGAFTHGRMVPVQRRIEAEKDRPAPMPWEQPRKVASPIPVEAEPKPPGPELARSMTPGSSRISTSRTQSQRESWGPQWRRKHSSERSVARETREQRRNVEVREQGGTSVSAPRSDAPLPRSQCDVTRDSDVATRTSRAQAQVESHTEIATQKNSGEPSDGIDMKTRSTTSRQSGPRGGSIREREVVERLSVVKSPAQSHRRTEQSHPGAGIPVDERYWDVEDDGRRTTTSRLSKQWSTLGSGDARRDSARASPKSSRRGSEENTAMLLEKKHMESIDAGTRLSERSSGTRRPSNVEYEYRLHTVRPTYPPKIARPAKDAGSQRSRNPEPVTLEVWQQVPTDPEQRAREAHVLEKQRSEAVKWLKTHMDDPSTQVGPDSDGTRRVACSVPHRDSDVPRPPPPSPGRREPAPLARREPPPQGRRESQSPRRSHLSWAKSSRQEPTISERTSRAARDAAEEAWPDREVVVEVWEQVSTKQASQQQGQGSPSHRSAQSGRTSLAGPPQEEVVIEAWKQVPSSKPSTGGSRRDSVREPPPARRRRERREQPNRASEESAHVKFSSKVDISPTPPGSDESSAAFRRFHDFVGHKAKHQIDGHESEERGEDLIAEFERRGRMRSREPGRRKGGHVYESRSAEDRDETVKPRESGRRYDGRQDDGWRPVQRALSESPSREWSDRKRSSFKSGPPYHPEERPTASMTTRDGSSRRW